MIERAFEEARLHKDNKRNAVRQFAIERAMDLLKAAGVVDPAIKDQVVATRSQKAVEQPFYTIPEGIGVRSTLEIGGKSAQQLEEELKQRGINVSSYAREMMHSSTFTTLEEPTAIELLKLRVQDLGLSGTPITKQIFERAQRSKVGEMILDLCPVEVGPYQRLNDSEQPLNDWYYIAHQQITDRSGSPRVFRLGRSAGGLWLSGAWAGPESGWNLEGQVVFSLRSPEPAKA